MTDPQQEKHAGVSASEHSIHEAMPEGEEAPPPGTQAMALVRWILIALMALAAVAAWFAYWGVLDKLHARATQGESVTKYYCPMHPSVVQDHPGDCPICSMTLVPKPSGSGASMPSEPGAMRKDLSDQVGDSEVSGKTTAERPAGLVPIDLSPERIQLLGMRTAKVTRAPLASQIRTVGYVSASEERLARIETRFAGWIEELKVAQTGEKVARGQVVATLYSPELYAVEQEVLNARRWSDQSRREGTGSGERGAPEAGAVSGSLVEDARHRLELLGIAREDIAELERTGRPMRALPVRSPVAGYVTVKNVLRGTYVQPGTVLFEVADLREVWVLAEVYESDVARVHVGQRARFAQSGKPFIGRVAFLYPTINTDTRTLPVRLEFANPGLRLRPGMYGDVVLDLASTTGLVVPAEALVDTGEEQYIFVARPGGHFEPRRVEVGFRSGAQAEIRAGLEEGETVVTTANFLLDSESRLRSAIEGVAEGTSTCARDFDQKKYPDKFAQCRQCELQHRGMGTMEDDCKRAIPKPWR